MRYGLHERRLHHHAVNNHFRHTSCSSSISGRGLITLYMQCSTARRRERQQSERQMGKLRM